MDYYIGTSGYSYIDWIGHFYPDGTTKKDMLEYYSLHFNVVELNFTYYTVPPARVMSAIAEKGGGKVRFSVKLNKDITHSEETLPDVWERFKLGIEPMRERKLLSVLLAQFPWGFKNTDRSWEKLEEISSNFTEENVVVEFRNSSWANEEVFDRLKQLSLGFCVVDEPPISSLMPWRSWVTTNVAYIRFHGRNKKKWFHHKEPSERYDYLYSNKELDEMLPDIIDILSRANQGFVFFNNHPLGKAVENAKMLIEKLSSEEIS